MEYHHIPYGKKTKNAGTDRANKKGQNKKMKNSRKNKKILAAPFAVAAVFAITTVGAMFTPMIAHADTYDEQINALSSQNGTLQNGADVAKSSSTSRQGQIDQLQGQINQLQSQINDSKGKIAELNAKIADTEKQIKTQGAALSGSLQNIYYSSQSNSTLNILMNSNSISDYVDAQSRQTSMQQQMQKTIDSITAMKKSIEMQKAQIQSRLEDQKAQQNQISTSQAQIAVLKAQDDATYNANLAKINSNNSSISSLKEQQRRANLAAANRPGGGQAVPGDPGKGGYPSYLANAPQDLLVDPWGLYNRECVSYAAWKVQSTYGYMPYVGGRGNAREWPSTLAGRYPMGSTPKAHSVAIFNIGSYGHAAWVESVNSDGTYNLSEYNFITQGGYGERTRVSASATFIYFGG